MPDISPSIPPRKSDPQGRQLSRMRTFTARPDEAPEAARTPLAQVTQRRPGEWNAAQADALVRTSMRRQLPLPEATLLPSTAGDARAVPQPRAGHASLGRRLASSCGLGCFYDPATDERRNILFRPSNVDVQGPIADLVRAHGSALHVTLLDPSYHLFALPNWQGVIAFKVSHGHAVAFSSPLCAPEHLGALDAAFRCFCRERALHIVFAGATRDFAEYGKQHGYSTVETGAESVLNPAAAAGALSKSQKSEQNRLKKLGYALAEYTPGALPDLDLERGLLSVYDAWRDDHAAGGAPQIYATVLDCFAMRPAMRYFYATDKDGQPVGLAFLLRVRGGAGYVLDPCVARPGAQKGTTDFLILQVREQLKKEGCSYLSLGMDPLREVGEVSGLPGFVEGMIRREHRAVVEAHHLGGKADYHAKFRPDPEQTQGSYLMFYPKMPGPRVRAAMDDCLHCTDLDAPARD